jgi:hypothetical protein
LYLFFFVMSGAILFEEGKLRAAARFTAACTAMLAVLHPECRPKWLVFLREKAMAPELTTVACCLGFLGMLWLYVKVNTS